MRGGPVGNLPHKGQGFVGREQEAALLASMLVGQRGVTLCGVGGVGKTRLAVEVAEEVRGRFPDGVWLVELSALLDPGLLEVAVAGTLQLADQSGRPQLEVLLDVLAGRRLLLILDTCEHLVPECAALVDAVLDAAPGVHVLATSRQPLGHSSEIVLEVAPLPASRTGGAAVELFAQRARAASETFVLDEESQLVAAAICRRLDGIPLSLELAAVHLREQSLMGLYDRLRERLDALVAEGPVEPWRHQALRTTIGWSHELCTPKERLLWARLSVFPGDFDAQAAQMICSGQQLAAEAIASTLDSLVDKSIVQGERGEGEVRFRMLDTVREYGAWWLRELGEEEGLRQRHLDYYRWLAQRGGAEWLGPDQGEWYQRTQAERDNLRAALDFALSTPQDGFAVKMAGDLWFLWYGHGQQREGRHYLERALRGAPPGAARTKAQWIFGLVACSQGEPAVALRIADQLAHVADEGDQEARLSSVFLYAVAHAISGKTATAFAYWDELFDSLRQGGAPDRIRFLALLGVGATHIMAGQLDQAARCFDELAHACEQAGEQLTLAYCHVFRAPIALAAGDIGAAQHHAEAGLRIKARHQDRQGTAHAVDHLAAVAAARGDGLRAARLLGLSDQIWHSFGLPQIGSPDLAAARTATEQQARERLTADAYDAAYQTGRTLPLRQGIHYALSHPIPPGPPEAHPI
ncbi:NB-ARC domain-containing protein [Streptomyces sp. T-3]|nr:NB-ARC domain-containing protein [Streptomyces sp. T-3]